MKLAEKLGLKIEHTPHKLRVVPNQVVSWNLYVSREVTYMWDRNYIKFKCDNCEREYLITRETWRRMTTEGLNPFEIPKHMSLAEEGRLRSRVVQSVCTGKRTS